MSSGFPERFYYLYENEDPRKSITRIDLLLFIQENPHAVDTAAGFARRLHRPLGDVAAAAEALAGLGVLEKIERGAQAFYRLKSALGENEGGKSLGGPKESGGDLANSGRGAERDTGRRPDHGQGGGGDRRK